MITFHFQVRDSFLNIFIFDNFGHVCFTFLKTKVGERGGGRLVCGREGNCHRNTEIMKAAKNVLESA